MKKKKGYTNKGKILCNIIAALAVINLVLLFVFDYKVPGFSQLITKIENNRDHIEGVQEAVDTNSNVTFAYDSDTLVYDGKKAFDAVADVTVLDEDGNELDSSFLKASITGETDKEVVYTYESDDGQFYGTENRPLSLENYEGPMITLDTKISKVLTDDNLGKLTDVYKDVYVAKDGFGKDITDQVTITAVPSEESKDTFDVLFSVTNQFGDTAQADLVADVNFKIPHLKLSKTEVSLKRNSAFEPTDYILYAIDYDGTDLLESVEYEDEVDMSTLGDYQVEYNLSNDEGDAVKTKVLTVHVVE